MKIFNNHIKVAFWNKEYPVKIQTRTTQIVKRIFINGKLLLNDFIRLLVIKNNPYFLYSFDTNF